MNSIKIVRIYFFLLCLCWVIFYSFWAFINADLNWVEGMFTTWSLADRFGFFFSFFIIAPIIPIIVVSVIFLFLMENDHVRSSSS